MMGMAERPWFVQLYETRPKGRRLPIPDKVSCKQGFWDRGQTASCWSLCARMGHVGTGPGPAAGQELLVALVQPISEFPLQWTKAVRGARAKVHAQSGTQQRH